MDDERVLCIIYDKNGNVLSSHTMKNVLRAQFYLVHEMYYYYFKYDKKPTVDGFLCYYHDIIHDMIKEIDDRCADHAEGVRNQKNK